MRQFGADRRTLRAWGGAVGDDEPTGPPAVWPINAPAVSLFVRVANQWRLSPDGKPYAIDHCAVWPVLAAMGLAGDIDTFDRFRVLEAEAISTMQKAHQ